MLLGQRKETFYTVNNSQISRILLFFLWSVIVGFKFLVILHLVFGFFYFYKLLFSNFHCNKFYSYYLHL